jgi:hypothetical protein
VAAGEQLYQRHGNGLIWRFTGTPLTGWELLDNNPATADIVAAGGQLYQRHVNGLIWRFTGTPLTGWELLDNNPATVDIVAAGDRLYQRHDSGRIWRHRPYRFAVTLHFKTLSAPNVAADTALANMRQVYDAGDVRVDLGGVEELNPFPGWEELDNNPATVDIVAAAGQLFQRHDNGLIWRFTGTPLTGWELLDNNPATADIVAAAGQLFQRHNNGRIFRFTGTPLTGWEELDNNPATVQIVAAAGQLFQRHNNGRIFRFTGTPLTGWEELDNNPATVDIVAADRLYQRHNNGRIWRFTGTPLTGWEELDNNPATVQIVAAAGQLFQRHNSGRIFRFTGAVLNELLDLDVGACVMGATSGEQDKLFAIRGGAGGNDLVTYFVRTVMRTGASAGALNGCASHPSGKPGVAIARIGSAWTLAHEVGHVLGLSHISGEKDAAGNCVTPDVTRLMTGCSTSNIVGTPTLSAEEFGTITSSPFVRTVTPLGPTL